MNRLKAIAFLVLMIIFVAALLGGGCSQNESKEEASWKFEGGQCVGFKYTSSVKGVHVVYFASRGDIEHITPFSSTCVGVMEDFPDPNSVKALAEGVVEGVRGL